MDWLWLWALLLLIVVVCCWATNIVGLPGNWLNLVAVGIYGWLMPNSHRADVGWVIIGILLFLALVGELIEFVAGAAGASTAGGSKRGAALGMVGALLGGFVGLFVGGFIPIPILGSVVVSLFFSALGALLGAMLGETWKGRDLEQSFWVGHGAFWGRLIGTAGKIAAGAMMIIVATAGMLIQRV